MCKILTIEVPNKKLSWISSNNILSLKTPTIKVICDPKEYNLIKNIFLFDEAKAQEYCTFYFITPNYNVLISNNVSLRCKMGKYIEYFGFSRSEGPCYTYKPDRHKYYEVEVLNMDILLSKEEISERYLSDFYFNTAAHWK